MDDLISRQAVKDWLLKWEGYIDKDTIARMQYRVIDIRPAEVEPVRHGQWNTIQGDIVVCSICGTSAPKIMTGCLVNRHLEPNRTNYCPNCGAKMEGE